GSVSFDHGHFVFSKKEVHAFGHLVDNVLFSILDLGPIDSNLARFEKTLLGCSLDFLKEVGVTEQRFGRNAPAQKAGAAISSILLDDRSFQTELSGTNRGNVSSRPRSDDGDVIRCVFLQDVSFGNSGSDD